MLLRIIPLVALLITLIALLSATFWRPSYQDGLFAPTHSGTSLF